MAYGSELILGWQGWSKIEEIGKKLAIPLYPDRNLGDMLPDEDALRFNELVQSVYPDALRELLGKATIKAAGERVFYVQKGDLRRELHAWNAFLIYDPNEMGDDDNSAVFGVNLTSRYFPTFLDWREEHGGSGDDVVFSEELISQIDTARWHLVTVEPLLATAQIILKHKHY